MKCPRHIDHAEESPILQFGPLTYLDHAVVLAWPRNRVYQLEPRAGCLSRSSRILAAALDCAEPSGNSPGAAYESRDIEFLPAAAGQETMPAEFHGTRRFPVQPSSSSRTVCSNRQFPFVPHAGQVGSGSVNRLVSAMPAHSDNDLGYT